MRRQPSKSVDCAPGSSPRPPVEIVPALTSAAIDAASVFASVRWSGIVPRPLPLSQPIAKRPSLIRPSPGIGETGQMPWRATVAVSRTKPIAVITESTSRWTASPATSMSMPDTAPSVPVIASGTAVNHQWTSIDAPEAWPSIAGSRRSRARRTSRPCPGRWSRGRHRGGRVGVRGRGRVRGSSPDRTSPRSAPTCR